MRHGFAKEPDVGLAEVDERDREEKSSYHQGDEVGTAHACRPQHAYLNDAFRRDVEATVRDVDWRPYQVIGAILGAALGLNLWTGNPLWFAYTLVGVCVFLVLVGLVRLHRWQLPPIALWTAGIAGALHYVGGSLSGLHQVGGPNGLYYVFPWWDTVVHTLGTGAVAVAVYALLEARLATRSRFLLGFLAVAVATLLGVLVELYEFAGFTFYGTVDQGYYTNTLLDLYYNLLGAVAASGAYARLGRPSETASGTTKTMA